MVRLRAWKEIERKVQKNPNFGLFRKGETYRDDEGKMQITDPDNSSVREFRDLAVKAVEELKDFGKGRVSDHDLPAVDFVPFSKEWLTSGRHFLKFGEPVKQWVLSSYPKPPDFDTREQRTRQLRNDIEGVKRDLDKALKRGSRSDVEIAFRAAYDAWESYPELEKKDRRWSVFRRVGYIASEIKYEMSHDEAKQWAEHNLAFIKGIDLVRDFPLHPKVYDVSDKILLMTKRGSLVRLAACLPKGSPERKSVLSALTQGSSE